jgi:hypothetical protein
MGRASRRYSRREAAPVGITSQMFVRHGNRRRERPLWTGWSSSEQVSITHGSWLSTIVLATSHISSRSLHTDRSAVGTKFVLHHHTFMAIPARGLAAHFPTLRRGEGALNDVPWTFFYSINTIEAPLLQQGMLNMRVHCAPKGTKKQTELACADVRGPGTWSHAIHYASTAAYHASIRAYLRDTESGM